MIGLGSDKNQLHNAFNCLLTLYSIIVYLCNCQVDQFGKRINSNGENFQKLHCNLYEMLHYALVAKIEIKHQDKCIERYNTGKAFTNYIGQLLISQRKRDKQQLCFRKESASICGKLVDSSPASLQPSSVSSPKHLKLQKPHLSSHLFLSISFG